MPIVFSRKGKSKDDTILLSNNPTRQIVDKAIKVECRTDNAGEATQERVSKPVGSKSSVTNLTNKVKCRANSNSPQSNWSVKKSAVSSVTFQSTRPTQIWQASPSPSPPAQPTETMDTRMISSLSEDWITSKARLANGKPPNMGHSTDDGSESNVVHSCDETNRSWLKHRSFSSCSSSDESVTKFPITICRRTSSSNSTALSESSSSLDICSVHSVIESQRLKVHLRSRRQRVGTTGSNSTVFKNRREIRRRTGPSSGSSSSSSSSSSADEELKNFGWDEKTIAAATSRGKYGRQSLLKLPALSTCKTPTNKTFQDSHCHTSVTAKQKETLEVQTKRQSQVPTIPKWQPTENVQISHPQSCLLSRRSHRLQPLKHEVINKPVNYFDLKTNTIVGPLAVITNDFSPKSNIDFQYEMLPIKKGDYVCVLNQNSNPSGNIYQTFSRCSTLGIISHEGSLRKNEFKSWLYVRRWCSDHLVVTGPPGFVPTQCCRFLSGTEAISLRQSQPTRAFQATTADWFTTTPNAHSPKHCEPRTPNNRNKMNGSTLMVTTAIQTRFHTASTNSHSPSLNAEDTHQITGLTHPSCVELNSYPSPHQKESVFIQAHAPQPIALIFGSVGSNGSETEDRDSGRGPSSGSEWGSGRCGSSNVTLDQSLGEKGCGENGMELYASQTIYQKYVNNSTEMGSFHLPDRQHLLDRTSNFAVSGVEPAKLKKSTGRLCENECVQLNNTSSPIILTTQAECLPVLEMRPSGTPTLFARETRTICGNSIESSLVNKTPNASQFDSDCGTMASSSQSLRDPASWEPYKTVIRVSENVMEKFTLV